MNDAHSQRNGLQQQLCGSCYVVHTHADRCQRVANKKKDLNKCIVANMNEIISDNWKVWSNTLEINYDCSVNSWQLKDIISEKTSGLQFGQVTVSLIRSLKQS